jgi:hypothetical protein
MDSLTHEQVKAGLNRLLERAEADCAYAWRVTQEFRLVLWVADRFPSRRSEGECGSQLCLGIRQYWDGLPTSLQERVKRVLGVIDGKNFEESPAHAEVLALSAVAQLFGPESIKGYVPPSEEIRAEMVRAFSRNYPQFEPGRRCATHALARAMGHFIYSWPKFSPALREVLKGFLRVDESREPVMISLV